MQRCTTKNFFFPSLGAEVHTKKFCFPSLVAGCTVKDLLYCTFGKALNYEELQVPKKLFNLCRKTMACHGWSRCNSILYIKYVLFLNLNVFLSKITISSAPEVTGSVYMQKFRLVLEHCGIQYTVYGERERIPPRTQFQKSSNPQNGGYGVSVTQVPLFR